MTDEWQEVRPEDVIAGNAVRPEALRDLHIIANLDPPTIGRLSVQLSTIQGYPSKESVTERLQACLPDANSETAESIVQTLLSIDKDEIGKILTAVDRWRRTTPARGQFFTDALYSSLERNLPILRSDAACLDLIRKAHRLLRDVGNEFYDVAYFCDLRPVFDDARQKVEGFVTLINMRMLYTSQDGERHVCELALTEDELRQLSEESVKALAKLEVLKVTSHQFTSKTKGQRT